MSSHPLQLSVAMAMPKAVVVVSSAMSWSSMTMVSAGQVIKGFVSSYNAMYCSAMPTFPQSSVAVQIRIQLPGQDPLKGHASMLMVRSPSQLSNTSNGDCEGSSGSVRSSHETGS